MGNKQGHTASAAGTGETEAGRSEEIAQEVRDTAKSTESRPPRS